MRNRLQANQTMLYGVQNVEAYESIVGKDQQQLIDAIQHQAGVQFRQSYNLAVSSEPACLERSRRIDSPAAPA